MLVLVSFGLVLLATILLIVGLFNDTLGLIYLSIAASVLAAVVLFAAFRLARPKGEKERKAPEPIDPDLAADETTVEAAPVAAVATAGAQSTTVAPAADESDDDWMDDDEWDDAVVDFPIADYDDLTVAEIMPLLPQLYSDELDTVIERERGGRNRSTIVKRLEELKVSGTEADLEDVGDDDLSPSAAPPPVPAPSAAGKAAAPAASSSVFDDVDDDFFPIADYDDLTVGQIVPLLGQLESDELEDVRAREASGSARKTVLAEIDRLLTGAPAAAPSAPAPAPTKSRTPPFPIADYGELTVADIRPRLADLSDNQLETVLDHERSTSGRSSVINEIERRLGASTAPAATKTARKAKKAATKTARKAASKTATKTARKAKKAASKPRFPIANYDELTVADIRPRLSDLTQRQLELVREREASGAARKSVLNEIDSRLS